MLLHFILHPVQVLFGIAVLLTSHVDQFITMSAVFYSVLPLEVELVTVLVQALELLGGPIKLNLRGLSLGDFLFKLSCLLGCIHRQLFNSERQLLDLRLISTSVLFEGKVVFFLLSCGQGPLFELFLVPVHFKFELVHALVRLENHVLNVVQAVLLIGDTLFKLFYLVLEPATLPLSNLLEVLFSLDLLVLRVNEALGVHELHLN